ncbi:hypothetical protein Tco_0545530 [Tanacetum coccineum]
MSVENYERVVAQRVANAIEAIAIYETKTNMARKSISQTEQQECKVAGNANNKRKWEGNHNGQCTVKGGNCKKAENKRKLNNTSKNNQNQQQPNKRQNTGKDYAAGHGKMKYYGGSKPLCPKCNYDHDGPCAPKCHRCNIVGHLVRNCRRPTNDNTTNNQRGTGTSQKVNFAKNGGIQRALTGWICPRAERTKVIKPNLEVLGAQECAYLKREEPDQDPLTKKTLKMKIKA